SADQEAVDRSTDELSQQLAPYYSDGVVTGLSGALREANQRVVGLATGHPREPVLNGLDVARSEVDARLAGANPLLPRGMLRRQIRWLDQELLAAVDSFSARDWAGGYSHLHQAAKLSLRLGDVLAEATINRFPGRFLATPTPAPQDSGAVATIT